MAKSTKNDPFKDSIEKHLNERAAKDPLFAEAMKKPDKNLDDCCTYIINQVKASKRQGFHDDEIFNMAAHYYDEDKIKVGSKHSGTVVVNRTIELSDDEKQRARERAISEATAEMKEALKKDLKVDVQLSEEELAEAKQAALNNAIAEAQKKITTKKPAVKKQDPADSQPSLF